MSQLKHLIFFFLLLGAQSLTAQAPYLVKDLIPGKKGSFEASGTGLRAALGETVIFVAALESGELQIFRSNGTADSTYALFPPYNPEVVDYSGFVVQGGLCWILRRETNTPGTALYATDGSIAGTQLRLNRPTSNLSLLKTFRNDLLYREELADFNGEALMRYNIAADTALTIQNNYFFGGLRDFAVAKDSLIYMLGSDILGRNLYISNGDAYSGVKVVQLSTGNEANIQIYLTTVGKKAFFFWKSDTQPYRLWVSDGTTAGTAPLKTFDEPFFGGDLQANRSILAFDGKLYFNGQLTSDAKGYELYVSDGTAAGTKIVRDIFSGSNDSSPKQFTIYNGRLWFTAIDNLYNSRTWSTNGTSTTQSFTSYAYSGSSLAVFQDSLVMNGLRNNTGSEIFIGKGTDATTRELTSESTPGNAEFGGRAFLPTPKGIYFIGNKVAQSGQELWRYQPAEKPSGVNDLNDAFAVRLSPNPGNAYLQVQAPEATGLRVFNTYGQLLFAGDFTGQQVLNTTDWPSGVYEVILTQGLRLVTQKWVKN